MPSATRLGRLAAVTTAAAVALVVGTTVSAQAITFGQPDGNLHRNVGALLADYDESSPGPDILCTGTMIDDTVFLTAGHCTAYLESRGIENVWVTFVPSYDEDSTSTRGLYAGTYVTHPGYGGSADDTRDIAVVLLERSPGAAPAQLPTAGLLDEMKADHTIDDHDYTAVGYGTVRDDKTGGPHAFYFDGTRRYALQSYMSLLDSWLNLSMQPSTGDGGTCYGDSGGPHFLGGVESNLIVSITVTGDTMCRATDKTYRLDTPVARDFLDEFVTLP